MLSTRVEHHRGAPERPLTHEELAQKYRECATMVLDPDRADRAREMIEHLEQVRDAAELTALLGVAR
jgi:2-methylcitrate dehydratase PrpD